MFEVNPTSVFTSDTHFNHTNIITYTSRPFKSATQMDEAMIAHWNKNVSKDQLVIHLGDFSFQPEKFRHRLNGKIVLVQGNHDKPSFNILFDGVVQFLPVQIQEFKCLLNHRPLLPDEYDKRGPVLDPSILKDYDFCIHGHKHGKWKVNGKHIDVGIDAWGGRMISHDELVRFLRRIRMEKFENMEPEKWTLAL